MNASSSQFTQQNTDFLNSAKANIHVTTTGISNSIVNSIQQVNSTLQPYQVQGRQIDTIKTAVTGILFGISALIVLLYILFVVFRMPRMVKGEAVVTNFKWFLFFILSLVFLLVASVIGEACAAVFEPQGTGLSPVVNQFLNQQVNITAILAIQQQCLQGKSALTIMSGFLGGDPNGINITTFVDGAVDVNSLIIAVNSVDPTTSFPNTDLTSLTSAFNSGMQTSLDNALNALITNQILDTTGNPALSAADRTALTTYRDTLVTIKGTVTTSDLTFSAAISPTLQNGALVDFKSKLDAQIANANTILGNTLTIDTKRDASKVIAQDVKTMADVAITVGINVGTGATALIASLNSAALSAKTSTVNNLGSLKLKLLGYANGANDILNNGTRCDALAIDFGVVKNSICISLQNSLDGYWLTFLVMALTGLFSTAVYVAAANALADSHSGEFRVDQVTDKSSRRYFRKRK